MAIAAQPFVSHRSPAHGTFRQCVERGVNCAMLALLWIVPLLIVLLSTRPAYSEVRVQSVSAPHVLNVQLGSAADMLNPKSPLRTQTINGIVSAIHQASASNGRGLVVLKPRDLTIGFDMLPSHLRPASKDVLQVQRTSYEQGVARMLRDIFRQARETDSKLQLTVLGLPQEPSLGSAPLAEKTNLRYTALMADFSAFVSTRTVQAAQSLIGEAMDVKRTMPGAVRFAHGRPIYYLTQHGWRMATGVPVSNIAEAVEGPQTTGIETAGVIASMGAPPSGSASTAGGGSSAGGDDMGGSSGGGGGGSSSGGGGETGGGGGVLQGTSGVNHNNSSGGGSGSGTGGSGGGGSGGGGGGGGGGSGGGNARRFYVTETVYPQVQAHFDEHDAQPLITVYHGGAMDTNNDGLFDGIEVMEAYFDLHVPPNYSGPLCLDWEGIAYLYLVSNVPELRDRTIEQFILAMNAARQLRPNAQVGMYALPYNEYWNRNQAWRDREYTFMPIYNASDCLFPSLYDSYKDGHEGPFHNPQLDFLYVKEVTEMALEMGQGKPVYPFVMARYHEANPNFAWQLIPASEFKPHVAAIFTANYQGDRADGLVWWGADLYFRSLSLQPMQPSDPLYPVHVFFLNLFNNEIPPGETDVEHFTQVHMNTLQRIAEVFEQAAGN